MDSTVRQLVQDGYLAKHGEVVRGKRKPSLIFRFVEERADELQAAVLANAAHHLDSGSELILIPTGSVGRAAGAIRAAGPEVLWGVRTGDSSVGLVLVVDRQADIGVRDRLVNALQPAEARRVIGGSVLDRDALNEYCSTLLEGQGPQLPPVHESCDT